MRDGIIELPPFAGLLPEVPADTNRDRGKMLFVSLRSCGFSGNMIWSDQLPLRPDRVLPYQNSPMLIPGSERQRMAGSPGEMASYSAAYSCLPSAVNRSANRSRIRILSVLVTCWWIPSAAMPCVTLERTDLVSRMFSGLGRIEAGLFPQRPAIASVYGYVGTKDFTLFPLIRPGSFVEIDSSQRRIENTRWGSVFERPIYFVELRDDYACSWCEEKEGSLLLIPFPQSGCRVREVRYPAEAGVIGRVTAVLMRIAESREKRAGTTMRS